MVARYLLRELPRLRTLRRRGCRYLIRADIGQFIHHLHARTSLGSTHQSCLQANLRLPRARRAALFGDELDLALRNMNEGQSVGIPIGPDTSLVIAEILLAAIMTR